MKDYHVVFEGVNGFQKEVTRQFPHDMPPPTLYIRDYQQISETHLCGLFSSNIPFGGELKVKVRCFRQRNSFYALGKTIVYYTEEL